jgi:vacuolar-type H+-ATPase subunit I/STV1
MTNNQQQGATPSIVIPDEVRQKFPEILTLILGSESMNDDERQYWITILLIMTPEQRTELKRILVNEKEQLAAIDRKYTKSASRASEDVRKVEEERGQRREERKKVEEAARTEEEMKAGDILEKIEGESGV